MVKCCKSCVAPKRHPGCHDHCPEYIAEKNDTKLRKEYLREYDDILYDDHKHKKHIHKKH